MANAPPVKPWGIANKSYLHKLIEKSTVDITKSTNAAYIDQARGLTTSATVTTTTSVAIPGPTQDRESSRTT